MATSQHAFQPTNELTHFAQVKHLGSEQTSIDLEHVSVSQLLGRDYLFIDAKEVSLPTKNPALLHSLLDEVVQQLDLSETHTVVVSFEESLTGTLSFIRYDLTWYKHKICRSESVVITNPEQHEFMEMIWRCSTAAATC